MIYYAERMALNITQRFESNILLYKNNTNIPFITGDTPIVWINEMKNVMSVFHYPISPKVAVELIISRRCISAGIGKNMVIKLDKELVGVVNNCNKKLAEEPHMPDRWWISLRIIHKGGKNQLGAYEKISV